MRRNSRLGILDLQAKSRIPIFIAQILLRHSRFKLYFIRNSRIPYKKKGAKLELNSSL